MVKLTAITMGDPAGIGPEIAAKLMLTGAGADCVIFGDQAVMQAELNKIAPDQPVNTINNLAEYNPNLINLFQTSRQKLDFTVGQVSATAGQAAFDAIDQAINLAKTQEIAAIVTAPIHKESLAAAGYAYPGHTEILSHKAGVPVAMMLANEEIKTVLVTIHLSLADAIKAGDYDAQLAAIKLAHEGAQQMGISNPRIAVAGLNPHAGEAGRFGREEIEIINPAIQTSIANGIDASGPWPGDTVFMMARQGKFDVVVAQYHDQGLIPVKYLGLEKGVNITLGLPFVRTSPDHGTAFDIAGQGIADSSSMIAALNMARQLVKAKSND